MRKVKTVFESLKEKYESKEISAREVAIELCKTGHYTFVPSEDEALKCIGITSPKTDKITLANFGEHNRDRKIGNSLYRICRNDSGKWYIHETYNDGAGWARNNAYYSDDLQAVIDRINSFTTEKEVVSLRF